MKNGKQILIAVIVISVFTFVLIGTTSNSFKDTSDSDYEQIEYVITHNAVIYAKTLEQLPEEGTMIITLDDLVKNGYYTADNEDGTVDNPKNSNGTLNGLKIKLVYQDDGDIKASIIEEE